MISTNATSWDGLQNDAARSAAGSTIPTYPVVIQRKDDGSEEPAKRGRVGDENDAACLRQAKRMSENSCGP